MVLLPQIILFGSHTANILFVAHDTSIIYSSHLTSIFMIFTLNVSLDPCNDPFVEVIRNGLRAIIGVLRALGIAVAVHGIVTGGLMRVLSFGNERRISESNSAIISSVVGLIIVLLAVALGNAIPTWFGQAHLTCPVDAPSTSTL